MNKLYHPVTLFWHDAEKEKGFRQQKYDLFKIPLIVYTVVDGIFSVYLLYLSAVYLEMWKPMSDENKLKFMEKRNNGIIIRAVLFI